MFKKSRNFPKKEGLQIEKKTFHASVPEPEKIDTASKEIDFIAFKDLQFNGSIEVKADPNSEIARGDYPYALVNRINRVVEANYPGESSLFGNNLVRLQNSVSSQMLNCFDAVSMEKRFNYLYLALDDQAVNISYNLEMLKAFEQAFSKGYSTMLTQLPFAVDYTESGLPRGDNATPIYGKTNDSYDKMGALIHYQTVLQNIVSPIAKYVELMSEEQDLKNMSYRRETPALDELYGQFKKKAFIAKLESLGANVLSEYFDMNWWKQVNTLRHIPSRKADDMLNPIITVVSSHTIPDLALYATETKTGQPYYQYSTKMKFTGQFLDPETYVKDAEAKEYSFEQLILNINKLLDPAYVLRFVRQLYADELPSGAIRFTSSYYQGVVDLISAISYLGGVFSSNMTEIRTFIDKLSETRMVYWTKNIHFSVAHVTDLKMNFYQVVNDVAKASLAGAAKMKYDDTTKRWTCHTMWDIYLGYNKFDNYSGGAFLAFSLRDVDRNFIASGTGESGQLKITDTALLLPLLFNKQFLTTDTGDASGVGQTAVETGYKSDHILAVTRTGLDVHLGHFEYSASDFSSDPQLSRLNPLDNSVEMKVPTWNSVRFHNRWPSVNQQNNLLQHVMASLTRTLVQICGYCRLHIEWTTGEGESATTIKYDITNADPDLLCMLDLQFADVSNQMITFARNYSPFRVATPDPKRTQGFGM